MGWDGFSSLEMLVRHRKYHAEISPYFSFLGDKFSSFFSCGGVYFVYFLLSEVLDVCPPSEEIVGSWFGCFFKVSFSMVYSEFHLYRRPGTLGVTLVVANVFQNRSTLPGSRPSSTNVAKYGVIDLGEV